MTQTGVRRRQLPRCERIAKRLRRLMKVATAQPRNAVASSPRAARAANAHNTGAAPKIPHGAGRMAARRAFKLSAE